MIHKATQLIMESFDRHGVLYRVTETDEVSAVEAVFDVKAGPEVTARFLSEDEENHVSVRVFGLLHRIPAARRTAALEACNELSEKLRFFKFCLDPCSNVNVETDLPTRTGDDCLGECCFELFVRLMNVLENEYPVLAKAVYNNDDGQKNRLLLRLLDELHRNPLVLTDAGPALPGDGAAGNTRRE